MRDIDSRSAASRTRRASVGLTALAVALLICGAAVETTGNLLDSTPKGNGGSSPPATTVHPTPTRSRASEAPSPSRPPSTSPSYTPRPTTATTGGSPNGR
jgi:hypothetical protein